MQHALEQTLKARTSSFFVVFNQEKLLILQKQASNVCLCVKMRSTFLFSCRFHAQHCKRPPNTCLSLAWLSEEAEASMVWEDTVLRRGFVGDSGVEAPQPRPAWHLHTRSRRLLNVLW